ncbi:ELWxxDGT repeat protein [Myxococcus sp. RHSTA-1-4]|uniref:ELWxxDGT repeat protein n=1 Tax=Myxococcus sp. RHSTA-1-4 TaxID=2874601 RepID=UPI001CBE23DC|nr:ELWxxDGT repeat protein [Myxococcus sp. RHSTA-1-4]MBZ4417281.1 HYR domain-containing protein [Myxococcus sp. RHSTA-1-4]
MRGQRRGTLGGRGLLASLWVCVAAVSGCGEVLEESAPPESTRSARVLGTGTPPVARLAVDVWPGDADSTPVFLANANGTLYFQAFDALAGGEPWRSDGTEAGTVRIAAISSLAFPGASAFTAVGDTVYFVADDGWSGRELWKTNGTPLGTMLVKNINVGLGAEPGAHAEPSLLTPRNGLLYFLAGSGYESPRLWRSDGTEGGTSRVNPSGASLEAVHSLANLGGTLVFAGWTSGMGYELWRSDGTGTGTVLIKDFNPGSGDFVSPWTYVPFTVWNGAVYFVGDDGTGGNELWRTDGTEVGTVRVRDILPGASGASPSLLTPVGNTLFFVADDGSSGRELWRTDGTEAGTVRVLDILYGATGASPSLLTAVGNTLFFVADDGFSGRELWKSDGTMAGTRRVRDIRPGFTSPSPDGLTAVGDTLFFVADDGIGGRELWKSDGTEAGTVRVKDIRPGASGSSPSSLVARGGILYFSADDGLYGRELWRSDGTEAGTALVRNIETTPRSSSPTPVMDLNGTLLFTATTATGVDLWRSDGTAAGTRLLKDFLPFPSSTGPTAHMPMNGVLYFVANDGVRGPELWKSDGTEAGTVRVKDIRPGSEGAFSRPGLTRVGSTLYFAASDGTSGYELWKSDGTEAGTVRVKDIMPGLYQGGMEETPPVSVGSTLYFVASDGTSGYELWKSDGTEAGTVRVKDIMPGSSGSNPRSLTSVGGALFFVAQEASSGFELWKSDGTEAGTVRVKDIMPGSSTSLPGNLTAAGGLLYFTANDGSSGTEVWKSDGTEAGTVLVRDMAPGSASVLTSRFIAFQGRLFFTAHDGVHGWELWRSDGTEAGTVLVKDIHAGASDSTPDFLTVIDGRLVFRAFDSAGSANVWLSDGTEEGTRLFLDLPGTGATSPSGFLLVGDSLYFQFDDGLHGAELWRAEDVVDLTPPSVTCPAPVVAEALSSQGAVVDYPPAGASDDVTASPELSYSHARGATFPLGATSVVVTARDEAGNTATCSFIVTVRDTTAPDLACPDDVTAVATSNEGVTVEYPAATASDAVSPVTVGYSQASGTTFAMGITVVTVSAMDEAGNDSSCTFSVTVREAAPPAITCPEDVAAEATGAGGAAVDYPRATATGTGAVSVTYSHPSGAVFSLGETRVTATARDERERTDSCSFTVTVRDTTAPTVSCPAPVVVEATDPAGARAEYVAATATDAVSAPAISYSQESGAVFALGTTPVTVTGRDAAGNVSTCAFAVTVRDTTAPGLTCGADQVVEATGPGGANVDFVLPTATDAVSASPVLSASHEPGSAFSFGSTAVTLTATDAADNRATCTFTVTVRDTTAPTVSCPADIEVTVRRLQDARVEFTLPGATDAASTPVVSSSVASGSLFEPGRTPVEVTATDAAGNTSRCTFHVTVKRTPVAVEPTEELGLGCASSGPASTGFGWSALALLAWVAARRRSRA